MIISGFFFFFKSTVFIVLDRFILHRGIEFAEKKIFNPNTKNNLFYWIKWFNFDEDKQIDDIKGALANIQILFESMIKISKENSLRKFTFSLAL